MQLLEPCMVLVGRAGQCHAAVGGVVLHVPSPSTIMLDLEQPGQFHFFGFENRQWHAGAGGPCAGGDDLMTLTRIGVREFLTDRRQNLPHGAAAPTAFGKPVETAFEQLPVLQTGHGAFSGVRWNAECAAPTDNGIEQHRFEPHIGHGHVGLHHRRTFVNAVADGRLDVTILILQHDT